MATRLLFSALFAALLGFKGQAFAANDLPTGCGPDAAHYKVKTEKNTAEMGGAPADKARLVFVQTLDGDFPSGPTSRFGVDGAWVGAAKGRSFLTVEVAPGTHQICASRQSSAKLEHENAGTMSVQVEAGQTYVYQFTIKGVEVSGAEMHTSASGVPGTSMTAKDPQTADSVELTAQPASSVPVLLHGVPRAVATAN